jgi:hypothetical protein
LVQSWLAREAEIKAAAAATRLAAAAAQLRMASLLVGSADLAVTLGVPLVAWVAVFAAFGATIAEARTLVRNENFQSGFSQGFVTGLLKWQWNQVAARFGRFGPGQTNPFDESLSYTAANAYNEGLRAGWVHASALKEADSKAILHRLRALSPGTRAGNWDRLNQIGYVIELAAAGRRNNVFRAP